MKCFALVLLVILASAFSASAQVVHGQAVHHCMLTPEVKPDTYPGAASIIDSNKPAIHGGKSIPARGQLVYLTGRIYDRNCVPVQDAKIELWQADAFGNVIYADAGALSNPYSLFSGSGTAFSDNDGIFAFVTVFPGIAVPPNTKKMIKNPPAPHLNFRITHAAAKKPFQTRVYFEGDQRNATDPVYKKLSLPSQDLVTATVRLRNPTDPNEGLQVYYDITLPAADPFRTY